jgi:hypothetical protein
MEEEEIVQGAEWIGAMLRFVVIYAAVLLTAFGAMHLRLVPLHPVSAAQWWGLLGLAVPVSVVIAAIAGRLGRP